LGFFLFGTLLHDFLYFPFANTRCLITPPHPSFFVFPRFFFPFSVLTIRRCLPLLPCDNRTFRLNFFPPPPLPFSSGSFFRSVMDTSSSPAIWSFLFHVTDGHLWFVRGRLTFFPSALPSTLSAVHFFSPSFPVFFKTNADHCIDLFRIECFRIPYSSDNPPRNQNFFPHGFPGLLMAYRPFDPPSPPFFEEDLKKRMIIGIFTSGPPLSSSILWCLRTDLLSRATSVALDYSGESQFFFEGFFQSSSPHPFLASSPWWGRGGGVGVVGIWGVGGQVGGVRGGGGGGVWGGVQVKCRSSLFGRAFSWLVPNLLFFSFSVRICCFYPS